MADDPDNLDSVIPTDEETEQKPDIIDRASDAKDKIEKGKDKIDRIREKRESSRATQKSSQSLSKPSPSSPTPTGSVPPAGAPVAGAAPGAAAPGTVAPGAAAAPAAAAPAAGGAAAAGGTAAGGAAAGGAAAGGATAGGAAIGVAGAVLLVVVAVFLLTGIIVALVYLPGSIGELIKGFFRSIGEYFAGEDAVFRNKDFAEVANIIQNRGYDLYAEGYINDPLDPETDFDEEGNIAKIPKQKNKDFPNLVELYTRMDAYTYRIRNKAWARLPFFHNQDMRGFLNFYVGGWDDNELVAETNYIQGFFREGIKVERETGILRVQRKLFGGVYNFQMDGWSGRYGLPLELFMALHQGTRAPDLVREIAKGPKAYVDSNHTVESVEFYDQSTTDVLYYKKPILNILLLETKVVNTVSFLVPESTTINGEVYVLKKDVEVGEVYDYNPFAFTDDDFERRSEINPSEVFKAYFKAPNGQYIRIKPKKSGGSVRLSYGVYNPAGVYGPPFERHINGVLAVRPYLISEERNADDTIKYTYQVLEESYDLSSLYFTLEDGKYKAKDLRGTVLKKGDPSHAADFVDRYGLYAAVDDVMNNNNEVNNFYDFQRIIKKIFKETSNSSTYIPLIKNSENHWFRDVYFMLEEGEQYVEEDKDYFLLTGEKWAAYEIPDDEGEKILTPKMATVEGGKWSAYDIKITENVDALGEPFHSSEEEFAGLAKYIFIHEDKTATASQRQEGRRGMTNARTKNLFANVEWYKYDGTIERADTNNEDRRKPKTEQDPTLKSIIDSNTDLVAAFEILEGSRSLDAQYILRDLKELYVELGYFEKEDLRDPVRRILRWPLRQYKTPKMWPSADVHQDPEGYGVFVPSKATLEEIYDKKTLEENEYVVGKGFEPDVDVLSPVTGRIEEIGTKSVTRLITDKEGEIKKITYKDVGFITISAYDETAPPEADKYKEFYDSEYKGVISGKVKHGKQSEDSRYIEGNRITIEGIKVDIPANPNEKENSSYIRQIKNSDLKKVQDPALQAKAEEIEQKKIDAPNYISISGSVDHIGDYIKEGTVIGKTTESDLRIIMQDVDKAFIENVDLYFVLDPGFYIEFMDDYYTKTEVGEPNIVDDVDLLRDMLEGYPILQDNAQVLLDMQEKYEVNALFIAAVTIQECGGGNSKKGLNRRIQDERGGTYNNIFSIQGSTGDYIEHDAGQGVRKWHVFPDYATAIEQFCLLISSPDGHYWGHDKYFVMEIATIPPAYCDAPWGVAVNGHITRMLEKAQTKLYGSYDWFIYGDIPVIVQEILEEVTSHLGAPYPYIGAAHPSVGFDCSGLVYYVYYKKFKVIKTLSHGAQWQWKEAPMKTHNYADGQPGDLIFFSGKKDQHRGVDSITHVGVYFGDNVMIHAPSPGGSVSRVRTDTPHYQSVFFGFARLIGPDFQP